MDEDFGALLVESMRDAAAHSSGADVPGIRVHDVPVEDVDVKAVRRRMGFTQSQMARIMGVSASGLRKWEQGQRRPSGPAKTLLLLMQREPEAVARGLG